ncbi:MAG: protein kinase [Bacteroidaceae bacterium]|nr:protein kinase [Bacteroidaceae bacterium]
MPLYSPEQEIGHGGMGAVYKIQENGRTVAVKMMSNQVTCHELYRTMFNSEVNALKNMNHPSVVKIIGEPYGDSEGNLYIKMEYIPGVTIQQYVTEHGPYSEKDAVVLMCKILDAMSYVHSTHNVHRDIKPSNIMLKPDGEICIIDFGIAKDMKTHTGLTIGTQVGTHNYMSPEQVGALSIDYRTDIYSLACLLYYMVTGQDAVRKGMGNYATQVAILNDDFPHPKDLNPDISDAFQGVILKAADKDMRKRYQTCSAFKQALLDMGGGGQGTKVLKPTLTIGRNDNCDIVVESDYVSGHHATIEWVEGTTGGRSYLRYTDRSTNGTGIDGRYVHNESYNIDYGGGSVASLPTVYLAGRSDFLLDWNEVIRILEIKGALFHQVLPPTPPISVEEKLGIGMSILCFLFPIVGWVLGYVWRESSPVKSKRAVLLGTVGFVIGFCLNIIVSL